MLSCLVNLQRFSPVKESQAVYFSKLFGSNDMFPLIEGRPQFRVWIKGVSKVQGSGLEGCPQFRGLD